jgi:hypothetical protein
MSDLSLEIEEPPKIGDFAHVRLAATLDKNKKSNIDNAPNRNTGMADL